MTALLVLSGLPFGCTHSEERARNAASQPNAASHLNAASVDASQERSQETRTERIAFVLSKSNNMIVPVEFNEQDPVDLMYHTAADSVFLTEEAVAKMPSVAMHDTTEMKSWGGESKSEVSHGNRVRVGRQIYENQTVFIDRLSGPGSGGKFGPALFGPRVSGIDNDARELILYDRFPQEVEKGETAFESWPCHYKEGSIYVELELQVAEERIFHRFLVHSGFAGTLLLDDHLVEAKGLESKLETLSTRELQDSFGNVIKTRRASVPNVRLGKTTFEAVPVEMFEGGGGRQTTSVMGGEMLRRFNWIFDPVSERVYGRPSGLVKEAFE